MLALFVAAMAYARAATPGQRGRVAILALIRFGAILLVAAMVFGAPSAPRRPSAPLVAVDASLSWLRAGGDDSATVRSLQNQWQQAVANVDGEGGDVVVFGDSLRDIDRGAVGRLIPQDASSRIRGAVDRAAALGRPLVIITDGEIDDPEAIADAPLGSRVVRISADSSRRARRDVGVADLTVPATATAGDTLRVAALLTAGTAGSTEGTLLFLMDDSLVGRLPVPALAALASTRVSLSLPLSRGTRTAVLQAVVQVAGDVEPRNDTLSAAVEINDRPAVVFVSTAPDLDVREALVVLRGALALPTRAYLRIAPNMWREEGTFAPILEDEVRRRAASAGVLIVHGDTTWGGVSSTGTNRLNARAARALWSPAPPSATARPGETVRAAEWYVTSAPLSPLSSALSAIPWDSLPPITLAGFPHGMTTVLEAKLGRRGDARAAVALRDDSGMRTLVISGSGYAGWSMRGGRSAVAFGALWGAMFDWLAVGRGDLRVARPAAAWVRTGNPIRWRRGGPDSLVTVVITPRSGTTGIPENRSAATRISDTLQIRFANGEVESITPTRAPGVYDVHTDGGTSVLVVNASKEWVPAAPAIEDGILSRGSLSTQAPRLSDSWWPFVAVLLLLSIEWVARRVVGLR